MEIPVFDLRFNFELNLFQTNSELVQLKKVTNSLILLTLKVKKNIEFQYSILISQKKRSLSLAFVSDSSFVDLGSLKGNMPSKWGDWVSQVIKQHALEYLKNKPDLLSEMYVSQSEDLFDYAYQVVDFLERWVSIPVTKNLNDELTDFINLFPMNAHKNWGDELFDMIVSDHKFRKIAGQLENKIMLLHRVK